MLACGGFERDKKLAGGLLQSRLHVVCSPPSNTGDGLKMAQRGGARHGGTHEAWWAPMSIIPGDLRDGEKVGTLLRFERQGPGSIMINRHGQRFANESQNYNDLARSLHSWDSAAGTPLNSPVHVVLFKFKPSFIPTLEQRWLTGLGTLVGAVPGLRDDGPARGGCAAHRTDHGHPLM